MILGSLTKQPGELFTVPPAGGVDFAARLGVGETISSVVVTATNRATGASSTATILQGAATISGSKIIQIVKAGADGEDHLIQFRVTTSAGFIHEGEVLLLVRETA